MTRITNVKHGYTRLDCEVRVDGGLISEIAGCLEPVTGEKVIDGGGAFLFPGLIDIHTHGIAGMDTMDGGNLAALAAAYAKVGTTTVYPTTVTASHDEIISILSQNLPANAGAHMPGFHVEGPYLSPKAAGAHDINELRCPTVEEVSSFPQMKILTLAPELPGALGVIEKTDACVALGHTTCSFEIAEAAFAAGAKHLTHTCNTMPPMINRNPGPIGAAFLHEGVYIQVIADGHHVDPAMLLMLYRAFGDRRMILISDSMRATHMPDGDYMLGGVETFVRDGVARTREGKLAGSTATLFGCVQKMISLGVPCESAYRMATETPASMMGLKAGRLAPGYAADFILVNEDGELQDTLIL